MSDVFHEDPGPSGHSPVYIMTTDRIADGVAAPKGPLTREAPRIHVKVGDLTCETFYRRFSFGHLSRARFGVLISLSKRHFLFVYL